MECPECGHGLHVTCGNCCEEPDMSLIEVRRHGLETKAKMGMACLEILKKADDMSDGAKKYINTTLDLMKGLNV